MDATEKKQSSINVTQINNTDSETGLNDLQKCTLDSRIHRAGVCVSVNKYNSL